MLEPHINEEQEGQIKRGCPNGLFLTHLVLVLLCSIAQVAAPTTSCLPMVCLIPPFFFVFVEFYKGCE